MIPEPVSLMILGGVSLMILGGVSRMNMHKYQG